MVILLNILKTKNIGEMLTQLVIFPLVVAFSLIPVLFFNN